MVSKHSFLNLYQALVEKEVAIADLKWIFEKGSGRGVYNDYQNVHMDTELVLSNCQFPASNIKDEAILIECISPIISGFT